MMRKLISLAIITTIIISGCCSVAPNSYPELNYPERPDLPKHPRSAKTVLDCTDYPNLSQGQIDFCEKMAEREAHLIFHIKTLEKLIDAHNEVLSD